VTTDRKLPQMIFVTGVDGCGKTTLAHDLNDRLLSQGISSRVVWSRFNNYLSKPLLALTRLSGHNHRETIDGARYGFHDFEGLHGYRQLFAFLQGIDVYLATWMKIRRATSSVDVVVCERGPWDTLVDVMSDTGLEELYDSISGRLYTAGLEGRSRAFLVRRDLDSILDMRKELVHDYKMAGKIRLYEKIAERFNWDIIDNNGTLDDAKRQLSDLLGI